MSRTGRVELNWADGKGSGADGKHVFRLRIGEIEQLQEICNAGPQAIMRRLADGTWRTQDVRDTLRLGLIGGGMEAVKAAALVRDYASDGMLLENVLPAQIVISACIAAVPDEPLKKKRTRKEPKDELTMDATSSSSLPSTNSAPPSDSPLKT